MTSQQAELLRLLSEIDSICRKHGLRYWLIGEQLLFACQNSRIKGCEAVVAMFGDDFRKFREIVESTMANSREIEGLDNNAELPGSFFRYVNSRTTMFMCDYAHAYAAPGIAVTVSIIRDARASGIRRRFLKYLELGMECSVGNYGEPHKNWQSRVLYRTIRALLGRRRMAAFVERVAKGLEASDASGPAYVKTVKRKTVSLPAGYFEGSRHGVLEGQGFSIPEKPEVYLKKLYGPSWASRKISYRREDYSNIASTVTPYKVFLSRIPQGLLDDEGFWKERATYLANYRMHVDPMTKQQKANWECLFGIGERYRLWKLYQPLKPAIMRMWTEGRHDELDLLLEEYLSSAKAYAKKSRAVYFDDDIWEVLLGLCRLDGSDDFADKLESLRVAEGLGPVSGDEAEAYLASHPCEYETRPWR